jgi:hypothetical protein
MKTNRYFLTNLFIAIVACLAFVGSANADPGAQFWSMYVGNYWVYNGTSNPPGGTWTSRNEVAALDTTTIPGVTTYCMEISDIGGPVNEKDWYSISLTEMRWWRAEYYEDQVSQTVTINGGLRFILNPMYVGQSWADNTTGTYDGNPITVSATYSVGSYANITVPLGTYKAYKISRVITVPELGGVVDTSTIWFVPYIGVVKQQFEDPTEIIIESLSSMQIKKGIVDYSGNGYTDVAAFHLPSDQFFTDYSGNLGQFGWGESDSMPLIWDYDGDGKTDVSIYHIPTNQWFVKGVGNLGQFGWGGEDSIPVPGDYNGDGWMERAFYHFPTNQWFVEGQDPVTFGWNGAECIPLPGDYDGDGKTDMVIYHIPSNQWFQYGVGNLGQFGWGGADCIPVPGDYNGDGKTEIAVYHVPTNQWFVKGIGNLGQYGWGGLESFPIPGDYNGDGVMERGFYRPNENQWFIEGESDFVWGWGGSDFMPITSQIAVYNWFRFMFHKFE